LRAAISGGLDAVTMILGDDGREHRAEPDTWSAWIAIMSSSETLAVRLDRPLRSSARSAWRRNPLESSQLKLRVRRVRERVVAVGPPERIGVR